MLRVNFVADVKFTSDLNFALATFIALLICWGIHVIIIEKLLLDMYQLLRRLYSSSC